MLYFYFMFSEEFLNYTILINNYLYIPTNTETSFLVIYLNNLDYTFKAFKLRTIKNCK